MEKDERRLVKIEIELANLRSNLNMLMALHNQLFSKYDEPRNDNERSVILGNIINLCSQIQDCSSYILPNLRPRIVEED